MKVIIAGSRGIHDYQLVKKVIESSRFKITEIVCGEAKGVDALGRQYAEEKMLDIASFPVTSEDWNEKGKKAGFLRNQDMADHADGLIAIWDGVSNGTRHMINIMKKLNKPYEVYNTSEILVPKFDVDIYTDGSCLKNPGGKGGIGIVMQCDEKKMYKEISEGYESSTNNRMELQAAISALENLKSCCNVTLYSDSQYVCNAFNQNWIGSWISNKWKNSKKQPVANQDLWKQLVELESKHRVKWVWVKGHNDHPQNEKCDQLAKDAANGPNLKKDKGYVPKEN